MHQIKNPPFPRRGRALAEILEIDEVDFESAGLVVFTHNVGLLQIVSVETRIVKPPNFLCNRVGDAFAAANVAALSPAGAEREAAQRIGVRECAAQNIRSTNYAGLVRIHRGEWLRMRDTFCCEHRGACERSCGSRTARSRPDP